jgi:Pheophorbide a oxygenase
VCVLGGSLLFPSSLGDEQTDRQTDRQTDAFSQAAWGTSPLARFCPPEVEAASRRICLTRLASRIPTWADHMTRNSVFDGDHVFLHIAEQTLAGQPAGADWRKSYYMPTQSDKCGQTDRHSFSRQTIRAIETGCAHGFGRRRQQFVNLVHGARKGKTCCPRPGAAI